jgi:hypothetical protein
VIGSRLLLGHSILEDEDSSLPGNVGQREMPEKQNLYSEFIPAVIKQKRSWTV